MRLLLVHNYYQEESGENAAFRLLAKILLAHGEDVVEYTRHNSELARLGRAAVVVEGFYSARTAREIETLVEQVRPRAAIVQNVFPLISPSVYIALRRAGIPTAQLVYNYRLVCPNAHLFTASAVCERCVHGSSANAVIHKCYHDSRVFSAWYAGIIGWHRAQGTFAEIDRLLVPDTFLGRKLADGGLPADRIRVVGTPFDVESYAPNQIEQNYLLFVGRLVRQKGILTLIRAFAQTRTTAQLVVIGQGEARAEAERLAGQIAPGRVMFRGGVWGAEMLAVLQSCLFVCVPSEWYDNAPLILHQAYAAGKSVIASRINGLPDVVGDGEDGLLAEPGNADDWAAKIERLAGDAALRRRMGASARRKAEAEFAAPAYYRRLRGVLDEFTQNAL